MKYVTRGPYAASYAHVADRLRATPGEPVDFTNDLFDLRERVILDDRGGETGRTIVVNRLAELAGGLTYPDRDRSRTLLGLQEGRRGAVVRVGRRKYLWLPDAVWEGTGATARLRTNSDDPDFDAKVRRFNKKVTVVRPRPSATPTPPERDITPAAAAVRAAAANVVAAFGALDDRAAQPDPIPDTGGGDDYALLDAVCPAPVPAPTVPAPEYTVVSRVDDLFVIRNGTEVYTAKVMATASL